jgi:hypothetical protein
MTIEIPITRALKTIVSDDDGDFGEYAWSYSSGYACRKTNENQNIRLHRLILERVIGRQLTAGEYCDHINGNRLDNRRENLRLADQSQNAQNSHLRNDNKSGVRGVFWEKSTGKWRAVIKQHGKQISIGRFVEFGDAVSARRDLELKLFGEFSPLADVQPPLLKPSAQAEKPFRPTRGAKNPKAKLTEQDVLDIRTAAAAGLNQHQLSRRYGVLPTTIGKIVARKLWKHL